MPYLIDTNLLIYPFDSRNLIKQARTRQVLAALGTHRTGFISSQVLSEFANVLLRRLNMPAAQVYSLVDCHEQIFPVLTLTSFVVLEAVRGVRDHHFAFCDAQIWATAKLNQLPGVLSEDFAPGSSIEGVAFSSPLDPGFDLSELES